MVGDIPSNDVCHYMDTHDIKTQFIRPNVVGNKVVLTSEFVMISHRDVDWSIVVALLWQASD
jgi:hypothetical protein